MQTVENIMDDLKRFNPQSRVEPEVDILCVLIR